MTGQADFPGGGADGLDTWSGPPAPVRTLIVGAGQAGRALARDLARDLSGNARYGLQPIGFLDDDTAAATAAASAATAPAPATAAANKRSLPLLGALADLPRLVADHRAQIVALAIPGLPTARIHELTDAALGAGAAVRYLPWHTAALCREATGADLRPLDIRALIDGPRPHTVTPEVKEIVTGKRVLVTGAESPLGAEIARQVHAFSPGALFLAGLSPETPPDDPCATALTLDIRDRDQTDQTFRELRPEVVFHAAGLRHAAVLERRPSLGVQANVLGTDNLVRAAARHGTERFVHISTGARPASMLGASQRVAEAVVLGATHKRAKRGAETVFAIVRVGEVQDAHDSLLTVLADQIRAGGPVTVTHPEATRSFATVEEAVALALDAAWTATGGETDILDLGEPMRVTEVVARFVRQYKLPEVPIRYVGPPQRESATSGAATNPAECTNLPERLDKLYKAAAKNRDPKVRQMLAKLAAVGNSASDA